MQHSEIRDEGLDHGAVPRHLDKHVTGKKVVPGIFRDHSHRPPVQCVGSRVAVLHEHRFSTQIGCHALVKRVEFLLPIFHVHPSPPDILCGLGFIHHILILCSPTGMLPHGHHQRTQVGHLPFIAAYGMFVEFRCGSIPIHLSQMMQTCLIQLIVRYQITNLHDNPPFKHPFPSFRPFDFAQGKLQAEPSLFMAAEEPGPRFSTG
jgi:hypothetical protein